MAFTDGITEAKNPEGALFGEAGLRAVLARARADAPDAAVADLLAGVRAFAGSAEQADDIAILAVRFHGPGAGAGPRPDLALELRATLDELGRAADRGARAVRDARGVPREAADDLLLGLDEVVANIIRTATGATPAGGSRCACGSGRTRWSLEIDDEAPAFDPLEARRAGSQRPRARSGHVGGLGVYLARSVVDAMEYERAEGVNRLRLIRTLGSRAR